MEKLIEKYESLVEKQIQFYGDTGDYNDQIFAELYEVEAELRNKFGKTSIKDLKKLEVFELARGTKPSMIADAIRRMKDPLMMYVIAHK